MTKAARLLVTVIVAFSSLVITDHVAAQSTPSKRSIPVPGGWNEIDPEGLGAYDGFAWYLLPIVIPTDWPVEDLSLDLGFIDDADEVFIDQVFDALVCARHRDRVRVVRRAPTERRLTKVLLDVRAHRDHAER